MKQLKTASQDYTRDKLPSNRTEVFLDVIRNRWRTLLGIGFLFLVFALPLLLITSMADIFAARILGQLQKKETAIEIIRMQLRMTYSISGLLKTVGFAVFSVGIAGGSRIIKRLIWAEGIDFIHDFTVGIRDNSKRMLPLFMILGFVVMTGELAPYMLTEEILLSGTGYSAIQAVITGTGLFLLLPLGAFLFSQTVFYENRFFIMLQNSIAFYGRTIPKTLPLLLLIALPYGAAIHYCGVAEGFTVNVFCCVLVLPLVIMIWLLYSCSVFDQYVNEKYYPEIVDKGIWRKNENDG